MSLPLPVFRLDARHELPFEPICAIAPVESLPHEAWPAGVVSRLQQWLGLSAAGPARGAGEA